MKNKIVKWVLVALVLVAVWYFFIRKPKATATAGKENAADPGKTSPTPVTTALSYGGKQLFVPGYGFN